MSGIRKLVRRAKEEASTSSNSERGSCAHCKAPWSAFSRTIQAVEVGSFCVCCQNFRHAHCSTPLLAMPV